MYDFYTKNHANKCKNKLFFYLNENLAVLITTFCARLVISYCRE